ncbi:hypothetical protein RhiirA5_442148 [Rhizophagus irregularis]|uniref:Uncharacterized protein n=1 Tax=Rhizophagus irregularis TaxID=588596 RepID=A0A2N0NF08_9GLOM|nr:hypothetical protein RhiirA5_442148 [Rhizophagus irregularis]
MLVGKEVYQPLSITIEKCIYCGWLINNEYTNDMFILDTINLSWRIGSSLNAPVPMVNYGATLLPYKNIKTSFIKNVSWIHMQVL